MMNRIDPLIAAVVRLRDAPALGAPLGVPGAILALLGRDMFSGIYVATVLLTGLDWYWGTRAARDLQRYDPVKARMGWESKLIGLILVLVLRAGEWWVTHFGLLDVAALLKSVTPESAAPWPWFNAGGALTTLVCSMLAASEYKSLHATRVELGASPIPLISAGIGALERFAAKVEQVVLPTNPPEAPRAPQAPEVVR